MCGGTHIPCIEEEMWDNSQELLSGSKFLYLLSPLTSICDLFIYLWTMFYASQVGLLLTM